MDRTLLFKIARVVMLTSILSVVSFFSPLSQAQAVAVDCNLQALLDAVANDVSPIDLPAGCVIDIPYEDEIFDVDATIVINGNSTIINWTGDRSNRQLFYVRSGGDLTLNSVTIQNANYSGGGAAMFNQGTVTLNDTTFANNIADSYAGAIFNEGTLTVHRTLFVGNQARRGGAIFNNGGTVTIDNSTFANNEADGGAAISSQERGNVYINNSTLAGNWALDNSTLQYDSGTLRITNTILANSRSNHYNCGMPPTDGGNNIADDSSCQLNTGNNINAQLGSLTDNGGPTLTFMPGSGSPAIDAGSNATCESVDQRGEVRPIDGDGDGAAVCDIGAVEAPLGNARPQWTSTPFDEFFVPDTIYNLPDSTFSDANDSQPYTATIFWGDGSAPQQGSVEFDPVTLTGTVVWPTHTYRSYGPFSMLTIDLIIEDSDGASDTASLTIYESSAPPDEDGPSAEDNARAQAPLCALMGGGTNLIVRADVPGGTVTNGSVFCRIVAQNSQFVNGPAEVGNADMIALGIIQAVDVFGVDHSGQSVTTFNSSVKVCLLGSGRLFFLSAIQSPRVPSLLPSTFEDGYTCATINNAGTVVLVP